MSARQVKKEEVQKKGGAQDSDQAGSEKPRNEKRKDEREVNSSLPLGDNAALFEDRPSHEPSPGEKPDTPRPNNPWGRWSTKVSSSENTKSSAAELRRKFEERPKNKVRTSNKKLSSNNVKKQKLSNKRPSSQNTNSSKQKPKPKPDRQSSYTTAEEENPAATAEVKQFSFPSYKILSGASVADVRMYPQEVTIGRREDDDPDTPGWAAGLFQNTKMSLRLRLLRLFLIWVFFRVLNKQTAWLSDKLGIGQPDGMPGGPAPKPTHPDERFIRVFQAGNPNPFHVRVRPGMQPEMYK